MPTMLICQAQRRSWHFPGPLWQPGADCVPSRRPQAPQQSAAHTAHFCHVSTAEGNPVTLQKAATATVYWLGWGYGQDVGTWKENLSPKWPCPEGSHRLWGGSGCHHNCHHARCTLWKNKSAWSRWKQALLCNTQRHHCPATARWLISTYSQTCTSNEIMQRQICKGLWAHETLLNWNFLSF